MKNVITILVAFLLCENGFVLAQDYLWAKSVGGPSVDGASSVSTDARGSVYMTGNFTSPILNFGSYSLTKAGITGNSDDIFISKYDAAGNLLWAKTVSGIGIDNGKSVSTDASGNVYITGFFRSPDIAFDSTTLTNSRFGTDDIFIAKYDSAGNVLWAKAIGGTSEDRGQCVSTDPYGNVYITGYFTSPTITFGSTNLTNAGSIDIFLTKYDSAGNVLWAKSVGGPNSDNSQGVSTDASGNVYITGSFHSRTITFDSTTLTNAGIFIAKYDSSGNMLWAKSSAAGNNTDIGQSISTDTRGNVYITGYFASPTITFSSTTLTNKGNMDIFIAKYDRSGNMLWAKSAGGPNYDYGNCISTDTSGNVYITGSFHSRAINFGPTTLTNAGSNDIFIVKYDTNGNVLWAKSTGGTESEGGSSVSTNKCGNVIMSGSFGSANINISSTTLTNAGLSDIFIVKYGEKTP